jgi:hypothetical protein
MTAYELAYQTVQIIDYRLNAGGHYRRASDGRPLFTLDEVIRAILDNDLLSTAYIIPYQGRDRVARPWSPILIGPAGWREAA